MAMNRAMMQAIVIAILANAGPASADEFYFQLDLSVDHYGDNELDGDDFDIDTGGGLSARIGKAFEHFRGEVEIGFNASTIDVGFDAGDDDLDYYQGSLVLAAYKDIGPAYIGAGAGLVYQRIETEVLGVDISDDETNAIIHGEAGFSFPITGSVSIVPHYRATWLPGFDLDDEVVVHSARVGLRVGF